MTISSQPLDAAPGTRFRVRVIRAGRSRNGNFYPDAVLRAATPLFAGTRVFAKSDREHLSGQGKDIRNLIGRLVDPTFAPGGGPDDGAIEAVLEILDPADPLATKIAQALSRGIPDLFGLSIDADAELTKAAGGRQVSRITKVNGVDIIVDASAGGTILNLTEAFGGSDLSHLSQLEIGARIERTTLPRAAKTRLLEAFGGASEVTEAQFEEALNAERTYVADVSAHASHSGKVAGLGRVRVAEAEEDKKARMLDAFFNPADTSVTSIRECYVDITGDKHFTGRPARSIRIAEALDSTSFAEVLGDAMQRRMLADYRDMGIYDVWRDLAAIVPVSDFREQHRVRFGGYGDLPKVLESAPYLAVNSPDDEAAKYKVEKRGGTETVTFEMIRNDDVSAVQRVPIRLSRAAKRTLSKFTLDLIRTNPVIYDGVALFHATHGNLGTAALAEASLAAGRLAMKRQKEANSNENLGIPPRFLWVPDDLEETAINLFRLDTNNQANFIQSLPIQIRPVWYWTDGNDWCLSADKNDIPSVEVGFLDGQEEPQILIQDDPRSGSYFTNDVITYKIRHIYGGAVTDFRGLYKSVVA